MRVYYRPNTGRPMRVAWALEEIGVSYEPIRVTAEEAQQADHLARHPLGRVPVLEQDGQTMFESTSLCLHVADQNPDSGLAPPPGSPERGLVYQWALFAMTELEVPVVEWLRFAQTNPERATEGKQRYEAAAKVLEDQLQGRDYLVGDSLTVADIVTVGVLALAQLGGLVDGTPNIAAYVERNRSRQQFKDAAQKTESIIAA
jgi:glutathione S-transferase